MKGILEFDLITEREEFETAQKAYKYKSVIDDLFSFIRSQEKHTDKENITWDDLREMIVDLMKNEELL